MDTGALRSSRGKYYYTSLPSSPFRSTLTLAPLRSSDPATLILIYVHKLAFN